MGAARVLGAWIDEWRLENWTGVSEILHVIRRMVMIGDRVEHWVRRCEDSMAGVYFSKEEYFRCI